jgi:hypothetical protein
MHRLLPMALSARTRRERRMSFSQRRRKAMIRWLVSLFRRSKKSREVVFVPYTEGDRMLRHNEGWRIAPEEDHNREIGWVWLERDSPTVTGEPT